VVCSAALAVLAALDAAALESVRALGEMFRREIESWKPSIPAIRDVRGAGLMIGVELDRPGADVVKACREAGLLVNCTADRVIRLLPPFCLTHGEVKRGLGILRRVLSSITGA
jgi:acetylornithine/succinyldiaminopimelate/putrescine aminotransferase